MHSTETGIYFTFITGLAVLTILLVLFVISIIQQQRKSIKEYRHQVLRDIALIEEERKRIAEDLHDDLGSILAAVRLGLETIQEQNPDNPVTSKTISHLDHSIEKIKEISHNLMPGILQARGLGAAIDELVAEIRSAKKTRVTFENTCVEQDFLPGKSIIVFRVLQEILTNTLKHARSSQIRIVYTQSDNRIVLQISDDGIGFIFEPASFMQKKFGLQNIHSRLELLEAKYTLRSAPGQGTSYQIEIPLSSMTDGHEKKISY